MHSLWYQSIRIRLLLPVVVVAVLAASLVGILSFFWGSQWAQKDVEARFAALRTTLSQASFPLTANVVKSLAQLTSCELVTTKDATVTQSSLELDSAARQRLESPPLLNSTSPAQLQVAERDYLWYQLLLPSSAQTGDSLTVHVLFDEAAKDAMSRRAALLPLLTGLSTILALAIVMLLLANRLSQRVSHLQQRVALVAAGDFDVRCNDQSEDEVGRLGRAVDSMATDLERLWEEVHRQESAKLLHQIAGGMAHQLRNTLTGSKMALELYSQSLNQPAEEVEVALSQLSIAEDYVKRLALVGRGQQGKPQQREALECLIGIQRNLAPIAKHLQRELVWDIDQTWLTSQKIEDASSFSAAISNLIINAIQAGERVKVQVSVANACDDPTLPDSVDPSSPIVDPKSAPFLFVRVYDDGPGIAADIALKVFEPFVSTKPEGIGLGLPLVRRAAEQLGGNVQWTREDGWTVFEFCCKLMPRDCD